MWQGRKATVGRSAACALQLGSALASRCHFLLQHDAADDAVWLTDASTHGTLVLGLPPDADPAALQAGALDVGALPWDTADRLSYGQSLRWEAAQLCPNLALSVLCLPPTNPPRSPHATPPTNEQACRSQARRRGPHPRGAGRRLAGRQQGGQHAPGDGAPGCHPAGVPVRMPRLVSALCRTKYTHDIFMQGFLLRQL